MKKVYIHSSVKTFLPGFGNEWLKLCEIVQFWVGEQNILSVILKTLHDSVLCSSNIHVAFETFGKRGQLGRSIAAMTTSSADLDLIS